MEQAYTNKKSVIKKYFHPHFSYLKTILNCVFLCCVFHSGLSAQVWFKEYSFAGTDHSIYEVTQEDDQNFGVLFKEDNTDIFMSIDNLTGATNIVNSWGESTEDIIGRSSSGAIKVGINGDSLQAVKLFKLANTIVVDWLKHYLPPTDYTFLTPPVRIIQLTSGDYLLLATVRAPAPFATGNWLIRIDGNGNVKWQKDISRVGRASLPYDIYPSTNDHFFIHSLAALGSAAAGQYIHKVDGQGNIVWTEGPNQATEPTGTYFYGIKNIVPTPDGGLVYRQLKGNFSQNDRKIDADGNLVWTTTSFLGKLVVVIDGQLSAFETITNYSTATYEFKVVQINPVGEPINEQSIVSTLPGTISMRTRFVLKNEDGSYTLIGISSTNLNPPFTQNKIFALRTTIPPQIPSCDDVVIEGVAGQINITGLTAPIEIVEVYDQNWQQVFRCQGTECGTEQTINNLSAGRYYVKVHFYDTNWQQICRLENVEVEVSDGGCDPAICLGDVLLQTQAEVDAFCGCEEIYGHLTFYSAEIKNLHALRGLKKVHKQVVIQNTNVTNLSGLDELESVGDIFVIYKNPHLQSLAGLEKLKEIQGNLLLERSPLIQNVDALKSLSTLEGISLVANDHFNSLQGFSQIETLKYLLIAEQGQLSNLTGLNNLRRVDGPVIIGANPVLTSLLGLENLRFIDVRGTNEIPLRIIQNNVLANCCSIVRMIDEDPTNGQILGGDPIFEDNPAFCSSVAEILANCQDPPFASCDDVVIEGGDSEIKIFDLNAPIEILEVYDPNWNLVFRCQGTDCGAEQIISGLSTGRHFVKVQFYDENWKWICGLGTVEVEVGGGTGCNNPDYPAMAAFANTLTDQSNTINWNPDDCDICNWTGVTCNPAGRVEKIELSGLPLRGTMPSEIGQLAALKVLIIESVVDLNGTIPTEIGNLTNLEMLTIVNQLEAPVGLEGGIPASITQLTRLKSLIIQGNVFFNEPIPVDIGNLTNLEILDLSYNRMPGTIPTSIGNLPGLHTLKLEHNNLTGDIPRELGNLRSLKKLILGERQPTGTFFFFGLNRLTGAIPSELGNLTELEELDFTYNPLSGQIPASLGKLTKIKRAIFQAFDFVRPTGRRDLGKLEGCFPKELSVWCDNGATVSFEGHLSLPYPTTKFPTFCDNIANNPTDPGICPSAGNCDGVNMIGGAGKLTISGLNAPNVIVDVFDSYWNGVFRCVGQECSETIEITSLSNGTYRVNIQFFAADWNPICRIENELVEVGSNGTPSCDDVIVTDDNGAIDIAGLTAPIEIVRIFDLDNGWQQVFECNNDCEDSQTVSGLTAQNYLVKVQMYTNNWGWICERNIEFSFGGTGSRAALAQMIRENKLLAVSPNPAQQEIYLDTKNLKEKVGIIRIYNTYGKLIETFDNQEFNTFSKRIDVSVYENGLYFLNVKIKGLPMVTQRFVVESLR